VLTNYNFKYTQPHRLSEDTQEARPGRKVWLTTLTVDLITADVEVYIVDNEVQAVPILVGQSFLNRANVTMVLRDNQIRLFEKHLAVLPDVDALPPRKLALCAKDAVVIPPRTIGFI
jgi:hypothetical protein